MPEDEITEDDIQHNRRKRYTVSTSMPTYHPLPPSSGESSFAIPSLGNVGDDVHLGSNSEELDGTSRFHATTVVSSFCPSQATSLSHDARTATHTTGTTTKAVELEERFRAVLQMEDSTQNLASLDTVDVMNEVMMISQAELDALCAREMWNLTVQEREDVLYDIHGVAEVMEETPEFCQEQGRLLEVELGLLTIMSSRNQRLFPESTSTVTAKTKKTTTLGAAYIMALQQNEAYVKACHLMFLRANGWNPKLAADRMLLFFQTKLALFGPSALTEKITIERHLTKEDRQALESGKFQLLPVRDTVGRAIVVCIPPLQGYKHEDNVKRAFFYIIMTALEDVETQKRGIVMVGYNMGAQRVVDRRLSFAIQYVMRILPFRMVSIHYCYDDLRLRVMMTLAMLMMGASRRMRLRSNYGNYKDVLYKLATFGIPTSALPIAHDGEPKNKSFKSWVKQRNLQEMQQAVGHLPQGIVVVPNRVDVLLGRGKPVQDHFGNIRYLALLDHFQDAYDRSLKFQMMTICETILAAVAEYGGRFLKQEGAGWIEVDAVTAREKVGHGFRTHRASLVRKTKGDAFAKEKFSNDVVPPHEVSMAMWMDSRLQQTPSSNNSTRKAQGVMLTDVEQDSSDDGMTTSGNGKRLRLWDEIFPK